MKQGSQRSSGGRKKSRHMEILRDRDEARAIDRDRETLQDTGAAESKPSSPKSREQVGSVLPAEEQLLREIRTAIAAELDLGRSMRMILDQAVRLLDADRGILFLGSPDSVGFVPVLAVNCSGDEITSIDRVSRTILDLTRKGQKVVTEDALSDPRFSSVKSIDRNKMRSIICTPLVAPLGQVGALYLDAVDSSAFPPGALDLLDAVVQTAAVALENARLYGEVVRENAKLKALTQPTQQQDRLLGTSPRMEALRRQVASVALMNQAVLIIGEPGTGRHLLARVIHDASRRASEAFAACDCSALQGPLLAGALLGREGVAVRGAFGREPGLVRQADRGTLYLSRVESLDNELAGVISRVAERGIMRPLGGRRDERVDVRLILAVGPDPTTGGRPQLQKELSGRLQEVQLVLPPLRERAEDIPVLALEFIRASTEPGIGRTTTFTPAAVGLLQQQLWPGNVRQLHQVLRRILLFHARPVIDEAQVRDALASIDTDHAKDLGPWSGKTLQLRDWEKEAIRQALLAANGNKAAAARMLGIHRNTLVLKARAMRL